MGESGRTGDSAEHWSGPEKVRTFGKKMTVLRWFIAFLIAFALSCAAWLALSSVLSSTVVIDGRVARHESTDHWSIAARTFLPTVLFVVSAVWVCPSKRRNAAFIWFAAALLCSGGEIESLTYYQLDMFSSWMANLISVVLGAIAGLLVSLRFQHYRNKKAETLRVQL
jgi:purine-cytosine permease-like protein